MPYPYLPKYNQVICINLRKNYFYHRTASIKLLQTDIKSPVITLGKGAINYFVEGRKRRKKEIQFMRIYRIVNGCL